MNYKKGKYEIKEIVRDEILFEYQLLFDEIMEYLRILKLNYV